MNSQDEMNSRSNGKLNPAAGINGGHIWTEFPPPFPPSLHSVAILKTALLMKCRQPCWKFPMRWSNNHQPIWHSPMHKRELIFSIVYRLCSTCFPFLLLSKCIWIMEPHEFQSMIEMKGEKAARIHEARKKENLVTPSSLIKTFWIWNCNPRKKRKRQT